MLFFSNYFNWSCWEQLQNFDLHFIFRMFCVLHLTASDIPFIFILRSFFLFSSDSKYLVNLFSFLELNYKRTQKTLLHSMAKWQDVSWGNKTYQEVLLTFICWSWQILHKCIKHSPQNSALYIFSTMLKCIFPVLFLIFLHHLFHDEANSRTCYAIKPLKYIGMLNSRHR